MDGRNYGLILMAKSATPSPGKITPLIALCIQAAILTGHVYPSITQTLAAGYTVADVNAVLMKDFNAKGATEGIPACLQRCYPRDGCCLA
jgi:hypothetical protein